MTLPVKTLRIGPFDFDIVELRDASEEVGNLDTGNQVIALRENWATRRQAASVALHEVLHAMYFVADIKPNTMEEDFVTRFEMALGSFFRDNQKFTDWLVKAYR